MRADGCGRPYWSGRQKFHLFLIKKEDSMIFGGGGSFFGVRFSRNRWVASFVFFFLFLFGFYSGTSIVSRCWRKSMFCSTLFSGKWRVKKSCMWFFSSFLFIDVYDLVLFSPSFFDWWAYHTWCFLGFIGILAIIICTAVSAVIIVQLVYFSRVCLCLVWFGLVWLRRIIGGMRGNERGGKERKGNGVIRIAIVMHATSKISLACSLSPNYVLLSPGPFARNRDRGAGQRTTDGFIVVVLL